MGEDVASSPEITLEEKGLHMFSIHHEVMDLSPSLADSTGQLAPLIYVYSGHYLPDTV